jgi:hypothetical protein
MAVKTFTDNTALPASDINTYLANSGWVYLTTLSGGGSTTNLYVDSVFTSAFDSYVIVGDFSSASASTQACLFRLRSGGADDTSAAYYDRGVQNTVGSVAAVNNLAQTAGFWGASTQNEFAHAIMYLYYPQKSGRRTQWGLSSGDAWNVQYYDTMGITATTTSYDGIKFYSTNNLAGTFRFYGIRQA